MEMSAFPYSFMNPSTEIKRKRGRPRKEDAKKDTISLSLPESIKIKEEENEEKDKENAAKRAKMNEELTPKEQQQIEQQKEQQKEQQQQQEIVTIIKEEKKIKEKKENEKSAYKRKKEAMLLLQQQQYQEQLLKQRSAYLSFTEASSSPDDHHPLDTKDQEEKQKEEKEKEKGNEKENEKEKEKEKEKTTVVKNQLFPQHSHNNQNMMMVTPEMLMLWQQKMYMQMYGCIQYIQQVQCIQNAQLKMIKEAEQAREDGSGSYKTGKGKGKGGYIKKGSQPFGGSQNYLSQYIDENGENNKKDLLNYINSANYNGNKFHSKGGEGGGRVHNHKNSGGGGGGGEDEDDQDLLVPALPIEIPPLDYTDASGKARIAKICEHRERVRAHIASMGVAQIRNALKHTRKAWESHRPDHIFYPSQMLPSEYNMSHEDFNLNFILLHYKKRNEKGSTKK